MEDLLSVFTKLGQRNFVLFIVLVCLSSTATMFTMYVKQESYYAVEHREITNSYELKLLECRKEIERVQNLRIQEQREAEKKQLDFFQKLFILKREVKDLID